MSSADQFEVIVSEHYERLFKFAMSLTRMESDAQDLTQETFRVWATKVHQLRDRSKVKTWLFTTLRRLFLATRRKQERVSEHSLEEVLDQLPAEHGRSFEDLDSSLVLPALARVDEVYQSAVALFYLEDCAYGEIATILGVPCGTVKSRIARGVAQLRELLLSEAAGALSFNGSKTATSPRRRALPATDVDWGHNEWVFCPIHLREQFGAL